MAMWPFRRKSSRKRPRSGAALSDAEGPNPTTRAQTGNSVPTRAASKKKQRTDSSKLQQRRPRAYSFSPGRQDDLGSEQRRMSPSRAVPTTRRRDDEIRRDDGMPPWDRTPTLHRRKSSRGPNRRKSSRRKLEDRERVAEIKAMSIYQPIRPATDAWTSGRPMKKDSKKARAGTGPRGHHASDVSLPIPESIHSSLSSDSEYGSFKVSALDSLAPRPTLRYSQGSRWPSSRTTATMQNMSQRRLDKEPIAEETLKEHKRVDDLADGLDARDLRELMEREDRRRTLKAQREKDRAGRRLARQSEKQRREVDDARKTGTPPPENLERGVAGREIGLGIDPASAVVTTTADRRASGVSEPMPDADDNDAIATTELSPGPQTNMPYISHMDTEQAIPEEPAETTFSAEQTKPQDSTSSLPQSSRLAGLLRSKKSKSKSTLASERDKMISPPPDAIDEEGDARKNSVGSERRGRFSLTSFLRWGGKSRRNSGARPSFSNTSREEMHAAAAAASASASASVLTTAQAQAHALARLQGDDVPTSPDTATGVYLSRKPSASAPKRTRSRFREDLPEYLMSPPDSRVQSPEAEMLPPVNEQATMVEGETQPISIPLPYSHHAQNRSTTPGSPDPHHSISMASIDSEGSWLSGKVNARRSAIRDSIARANRYEPPLAIDSPTNSTQEDLILSDDYMSRLAPNRNSGMLQSSRLSEDGRPSSDEEDISQVSGARWGAVGARPNVVHVHKNDRSTMQSHEGLLNIESGDEEGNSSASPTTPSVHEKADLRRARSVNLGKGGHARNFSAGSAKLLDITPRSSVDSKARPVGRRASVPLQ